jgi:nucleoside-diphosphate-sugar epimerase
VADTQKAKEKLDFIPKYSLREAIHETIGWYREENWL